MTDKELLEKAARAAGIVGTWERRPDHIQERWYFNVPYDNQGMLTGFEWNPLTDDADAFRLAVKVGIDTQQGWMVSATAWAEKSETHHFSPKEAREEYGSDPYAATRRAIVRAAAAIGETME